MSSVSQPLKVLLVEDSPHYVRLVYEAFRQINPAIQLHSVGDGVETMSFLRQEEPHANAPRPDIILLDLNLPKMDGREVLAQIKEDADLKTIPTVVLTTSDSDDDVKRSYELHANSYLRKPLKWDDFVRLVISLNNFWLNTSVLPRH